MKFYLLSSNLFPFFKLSFNKVKACIFSKYCLQAEMTDYMPELVCPRIPCNVTAIYAIAADSHWF